MWFYIEYYIELQKHDLVYNGINIVMVGYTKKLVTAQLAKIWWNQMILNMYEPIRYVNDNARRIAFIQEKIIWFIW